MMMDTNIFVAAAAPSTHATVAVNWVFSRAHACPRMPVDSTRRDDTAVHTVSAGRKAEYKNSTAGTTVVVVSSVNKKSPQYFPIN